MEDIRDFMKMEGLTCKKYNHCLDKEVQRLSCQKATIFLTNDDQRLMIINRKPIVNDAKKEIDIQEELDKGKTKE